MKTIVSSVFMLLALVIVSGMVVAFSDGSNFTGSTGAPGEMSCSCHGAADIGSGSASIDAQGAFMPGDTINVTARVENAGTSRWGFAVTVLDNNDEAIGEMIVTDPVRTLKTESNNRQYIKHTETGTDWGTADSTVWQFQWVAPDNGVEEVTFYMSGMASDGNFLTDGDSSYTTSLLISRTGVADDVGGTLPNGYELTQNYPNPFNPTTTIEYNIPHRSFVTVTVYNARGQKIRTVVQDTKTAGKHTAVWDGKDYFGNKVSSGVYLYQIRAEDFIDSKKMLLVK